MFEWTKLQRLGFRRVRDGVDRTGATVWLVRCRTGELVAMHHDDIADLVTGHLTLDDVVKRDRCADMPAPFPEARRPIRRMDDVA